MSYLDENWKDMLEKKFPGKNGDEIWKDIQKKILKKFPKTQYQPKEKDIFNVFEMLRSEIKVVILGQDPYPEPGKATGYAFAVPPEYKLGNQESLSVIIKEIEKEFKKKFKEENKKKWQTLKHWRDSGVFLLNTALTVEKKDKNKSKSKGKNKKEEGSHLDLWKEIEFTKKVIEYISEKHPYPCIWMLWGVEAKKFKGKISNGILVNDKNIEKILKEIREERHIKDNYILEAPHPSPQNHYKFCNTDHNNFLNANKILNELYEKGIEW
jgi:uracil-DNA glycosylase